MAITSSIIGAPLRQCRAVLLALLLTLLLIGPALAAAAPAEVAVVLLSYGTGDAKPNAATGEVLALGRELVLPAGAELQLIDHIGRRVAVRGPWRGKVDALVGPTPVGGPQVGFAALGQALNSEAFAGVRRAGLGDPWTIDLDRGDADICFRRAGALNLMRGTTGRDERLRLTAPAGQMAEVAWPASQRTAPWPERLARQDGLKLAGSFAGDGKRIELLLHQVPDDLPTRVHVAAWMAERRCTGQARLLLLSAEVDKLIDALETKNKF